MAQRKKLRQEVDELRGEIAALRAERANQLASARKAKPSPSEPQPETGDESDIGKDGDLVRAIAEFAEGAESEIAEHPAIVVALAFLFGLTIGRHSKS